MSKIAIVTDSTAYLPKEVRQQYKISMVPLSVNFGAETFREEVEITTEQFYTKLRQTEALPTTSQPAVGDFVSEFERLAEEGYTDAITIHLSSGISGTYQTAMTAAEMVKDKIMVYGFDSEISCLAQGFYVLEASEMAAKDETVDTILDRLEQIKQSLRAYFMVDDLKHLHRGGRLNGAQLIMGSLLQIKPILHFEDKLIVPFEKVRTSKKAIKMILDMLAEDVKSGDPYKATVVHGNDPEAAKKLADQIRETHSNVEVIISYFGPVVGTHLGEGSLAVCWYNQKA